MKEWGIPPHVWEQHYTDQEFNLYLQCLQDRLKDEHEAVERAKRSTPSTAPTSHSTSHHLTEKDLLKKHRRLMSA